jgi:8-oxo-dGTP pyrophosphatase MutT (NUDIX family)
MREIQAAGVLVMREEPNRSFLLLKHRDRWDLPKGHTDEGESDLQCALRELHEETGIAASDIQLDPDFRLTLEYEVQSKRFGERCRKTVAIFLARLIHAVPIVLTEHIGYRWFAWQPPHRIQSQTIDPVLAAVEKYLAGK